MKQFFASVIIYVFIILVIELTCQSWVRKNEGYGFWSIAKDYAGNIYAGTTGTPRGIFKSTDGGETWTNVYTAGASNYLEIACDPQNNVYVANGSNGIMVSTDGGNSFSNIPASTFGGNSVNTVACGQNGLVLAGVTSGGIYRSTNYGVSFSQVLSGYSIVSMKFDRFNPNRIYAGSSSTNLNGFFISTDGGATFSGPTNSINVWEILQTQNGDIFTLGTSSGYPVLKSTDLGLTWNQVGATSGAIRGACLDLIENFYVAGNGGVFKSTNRGQTFTNMNLTFSSNKIISYQNKILVAVSGTTNGGVYIYTDQAIPVELISFSANYSNGKVHLQWVTASELNNSGFDVERNNGSGFEKIGFVEGNGTTTEKSNFIFVDENPGYGKIQYRLKQIDFDGTFKYYGVVEVDANIPTEFSLSQNYPNPFNPVTIIKYSIPTSSHREEDVSLKVYDILGNEVATLVNEIQPAGNYEVEFDARSLPSGMYIYKLEAGSNTIAKKMMLLK